MTKIKGGRWDYRHFISDVRSCVKPGLFRCSMNNGDPEMCCRAREGWASGSWLSWLGFEKGSQTGKLVSYSVHNEMTSEEGALRARLRKKCYKASKPSASNAESPRRCPVLRIIMGMCER